MTQPNNPLAEPAPDAEVCGNCKFSKVASVTHVACFGAPPSVVLMGQRQGKLAGQVDLHFENMRPILGRSELPCSLFQRRFEIRMVGETSPIKPQGH